VCLVSAFAVCALVLLLSFLSFLLLAAGCCLELCLFLFAMMLDEMDFSKISKTSDERREKATQKNQMRQGKLMENVLSLPRCP
jgi:hypothetical protein